ncbi:MAG: hypothetical protein HY731_03625 [Candidatus Tectomicrobia bacterium]|nr:hypothetical protein [Candidatus Tectomicrobia bacterium]
MSTTVSPVIFASEIADGFNDLTPSMLDFYSPLELRKIYEGLVIVQREIRSAYVNREDALSTHKKQMKLQRVAEALDILEQYCHRHRIAV